MIKLNLAAKGSEQELILEYLQENASEVLAEKINKGVPVEKDGKRLISKKTLDGFMKYACAEARKLAAKGAQSACVKSDIVFGWAIHFFEEDSIEGTLYNPDGSEYKPAVKATPKTTPAPAPQKKENPQMSLFGWLDTEKAAPMSEQQASIPEEQDEGDEENEDEEELEIEDEQDEEPQPQAIEQDAPKPQGSPMYQCYQEFAEKYSDSILFLRVGDFYEALGNHARRIADELNLTLTGRDCGLTERIPMIGIPYHVFEVYVGKLLERGYKVAVTEDLSGYHFANEAVLRIDEETGEVLSAEPQTEQDEDDDLDDLDTSAFDSEAVALLSERFGDEITVR